MIRVNISVAVQKSLREIGQTQAWLAERMGRKTKALSVVAKGNSTKQSTLEELANAFGKTPSEFVAMGEYKE